MAKVELTDAYTAVFMGGASDTQREMVLADLAGFSKFYGVGTPGMDLAELNGMRKVFGRIQEHIKMPPNERAALEMAARKEMVTDVAEGEY